MSMSKAIFVCVCLAALTPLVWSQNKGIGAFGEKGIPGFLNPHTGTFTTRAQGAGVKPQEEANLTGTATLFREQFDITITNYDQPTNSLAVCSVEISTEDTNGFFDDSATAVATASGNTWTCNVPVLTLWTLQNATGDTLSACVSVDIIQTFSIGTVTQAEAVRGSEQPCLSLTVPANTQTKVNSFSFTL